jgi:hypothetical protein
LHITVSGILKGMHEKEGITALYILIKRKLLMLYNTKFVTKLTISMKLTLVELLQLIKMLFLRIDLKILRSRIILSLELQIGIKNLNSYNLGMDEIGLKTKHRYKCPICGKTFIFCAILHMRERKRLNCEKFVGCCKTDGKSSGSATIMW